MPTTKPITPQMALLIDADNISHKYLPTILNEVPKYGVATYRRIYGDFTDPQAAKWREPLLDNSILPVQQFSNVKHHKPGEQAGKNATDSTLIIDAMDILYAGKVDGFVIVSSDSDFTRLAQRLRESNMIVVGMGLNHTSISFRHACTSFVNIEYLYKLERRLAETPDEIDEADSDDSGVVTTVKLADVEAVIAGIIRNNDNKGETTQLAEIGAGLRNKFPDFDVRNFNYTQLWKMVDDMKRFSLTKSGNVYTIALADTSDMRDRVSQFVRKRIAKNKTATMNMATLANEVYEKFPTFKRKLKDLGYTQFGQFVESIEGVSVQGANRQQAKLRR